MGGTSCHDSLSSASAGAVRGFDADSRMHEDGNIKISTKIHTLIFAKKRKNILTYSFNFGILTERDGEKRQNAYKMR